MRDNWRDQSREGVVIPTEIAVLQAFDRFTIDRIVRLSIVVPTYQSRECLDELCSRVHSSATLLNPEYELILVDDGSRDGTWRKICDLGKQNPKIRGVRFSRNFGQHYAISAGLKYSQGDWVVIMDCDLQDRPEDIPQLFAKAQEGFDVVLGLRNRDGQSWLKKATARLFYQLLGFLTGVPQDSRVGNFRIMSRAAVENYLTFNEHLRFFGALVSWLGLPTSGVEVQHDKRTRGQTAYGFVKMFRLASNAIIAHSDKPLRLSIAVGLLTVAFSLSFASFVTYRFLFYRMAVTGWSSLIVTICFFSGIIILNLGIIGIYLGKVFEEVKNRPLFIIRDKFNFTSEPLVSRLAANDLQ